MSSVLRIAIGIALLSMSSGCRLKIVPTFTDSGGQTWTDRRKAVALQGIADYQRVIADDETIAVEFKFFDAEPGYYGMWYATGFPPKGTSVRPWTEGLTHVIMIDANSVGGMVWFDPTPSTDDDIPENVFDALTLIRHELTHMLGHRPGYIIDYDADRQATDRWQARIDASGVFDPGGLNVALADDLEHVDEEDLMSYWLTTGRRYDIDDALQRLIVAHGYKTVAGAAPVRSEARADSGTETTFELR
ncbi:MAG: hypothetical protein ACYS8X_10810 [Planctomycetota bacterium]|jgi:hypothetical protein